MENNRAINRIYDNLQAGAIYGEYVLTMRFPYFSEALFKTIYGNIGWSHYGSSANKNTINQLAWIIEVIFKTTPEQFEQKYTIYDKNNIWRA